MAKKDDRPLDVGLAGLHGESEDAATAWWKGRLALIAAIPTDLARAGALVPQLRELARFPEAERRRLTKARLLAFQQLSAEDQQKLYDARKRAAALEPDVLQADVAVVRALQGEVAFIAEYLERSKA